MALKQKIISLRVGAYLARRQIMRANIWTTFLIISIMVLTFLNLVAVSGILVGLIEGAGITYRQQYSGDVLINTKLEKKYIQDSVGTIAYIRSLPDVVSVTGRYVYNGTVEANYKNKIKPTDKTNSVGTGIVGIDPRQEDRHNNLRSLVVDGRYLSGDDYGEVLVGSLLLDQYMGFSSPTFPALHNVRVGDRIRLVIGDNTREVIVRGVIKSKVDEVSRRIFMNDQELRGISGRSDKNVNEISVKLRPGVDPVIVKNQILAAGFGRDGNVMTWEESQGKFFDDMKNTFNMLGTGIGLIGLMVASITIFIVIFINAVTRRKFIGILKGIGVSSLSIEVSYVFQSMFYAFFGTVIGLFIVYFGLVPYFQANPVDFPFSDGIIVAPVGETFFRAILLFVTTVIAGYIPARLIINKNTLDSILGR